MANIPSPQIYETRFEVVVLSEEPIPEGLEFTEILYQIDEGDWIGSISKTGVTPLGVDQARERLGEIGNDGTFFDTHFDPDANDL